MVQLFDYDSDAPPDLVVESQERQGNAIVQTISYAGGMGFRVPAYLILPGWSGTYPAVVYLHKGGGHKTQFLSEALMLADMGVVSLLLDSPFVPRPYGGDEIRADYPGTQREGRIRQVIDIRRGVDLLETLPEVDASRIGYVGHSHGAVHGGIVSGIEMRIRAYVLIAGLAQNSAMQSSTFVPPGMLAAESDPDLDAIHYVGQGSQAAILFQFGELDRYVDREQAHLFSSAAGEPKAVLWYTAYHDDIVWKGREDRLQWLGEQLGFESQVGRLNRPGTEPVTRNEDWMPQIEELDGVLMALVPAGCFQMGSSDEQVDDAMRQCEELRGPGNCERSWYEHEQPATEQCFDELFWIDVYEVTNAQFGSPGEWAGEELPREHVNWADALAHCERRGGRLPTEAEWEYAARGPDGLAFPWGNEFERALLNSCDRNCEWNLVGTRVDDGYAETAPVGSFPGGASWVGAMDMSGNVWEWTSSIYKDYPYSAADGREVDGGSDSSRRVLRGGSWFHSGSDLLRSAARYGVRPDFADYATGFRCVVTSR